MNTTNDIIDYEDRLRDISEIEEFVEISEDILRESTGLDSIAILNIVDEGDRLCSCKFDKFIDIDYKRYAIILECYYTKRVHHIRDVTTSFLYDSDIDNIFDIDIDEVMVIPITDEAGDRLSIIYLASENSMDISIDQIVPVVKSISNKLSMIHRDKLLIDSTINMLLVDNSFIMLKYLSSILKRYDIKIHTAICGVDAINQFESNRIDIILIEEILGIEGRSGNQTIDDIRKIEIDRGQDPIPILGITSDTSRDSRERLLNSGANSILYKPIEPDEAISTIKQFTVLKLKSKDI